MNIKLISLMVLLISLIECETVVRSVDSYEINMMASNLNNDFLSMGLSSSIRINYKDDTYMMLHKPNEDSLRVELFVYNPGYYNKNAETGEETHGNYTLAEETSFEWNELAQTLVPTVCKSAKPEITTPTVQTQCAKGVQDGTRMIALQIMGTINLEEAQNLKDLENCVSDKLDKINDKLEYTSCMLKVLGDLKYAEEAKQQKIKEEEAKGKVCLDNAYCYFQEDKQILSQIINNLKGSPHPISIYKDSRPRLCQLEETSFGQTNLALFESMGVKTFRHTCNSWVQAIYFKPSDYVLDMRVEFVSFTQDEDGKVTNHGTSFFSTIDFDINDQGVQKLEVDWMNGVRIQEFRFNNLTDNACDIVKEIKVVMNNGSNHLYTLTNPTQMDSNLLKEVKVVMKGELAGLSFARLRQGLAIEKFIQRT